MKVLELLNTLSLVVTAASLVWIAILLRSVLSSTSSLIPALHRYFSKVIVHDPDPGHHAFAPRRNKVIWEWRGGQWVLRDESGPIELAGPPPTRPGTFESECVTTYRPDIHL